MLTLPNSQDPYRESIIAPTTRRDTKFQGVPPRSPRATLRFCPPNAWPLFPSQSAKSTLTSTTKPPMLGSSIEIPKHFTLDTATKQLSQKHFLGGPDPLNLHLRRRRIEWRLSRIHIRLFIVCGVSHRPFPANQDHRH